MVGSRFANIVFVGAALIVCFAASAGSGSLSTTSGETTTAGATTDEDTNLPAYARDLQPQIEEQMSNLHVPGALVYVDVPAEGTWSMAFGNANLEASNPITPDDHFRIGSTTKTFTGTVVLQLVDEGKLGLDDPVSKYQPEVPNGENITIRQLLNMSSGLFNYVEDEDFAQTLNTEPQKVWEPKDLVAIGLQHQPYFSPGDGFHYSNTNTVLLGMIVEQLTGQPLEKEFQERLFVPLGMSESLLPQRSSATIPAPHPRGFMYQTIGKSLNNSELQGAKATQAAEEAEELRDVTDHNPSWAWVAGGGISTINDLIIWAKADATGQLLSPETQKERLSWVSAPLDRNVKYGLAIGTFWGFIGHNGQLPGFNSFVGYDPKKDATIVVVTDVYLAPDGSSPATEIMKSISKELSSINDEGTGESTTGYY